MLPYFNKAVLHISFGWVSGQEGYPEGLATKMHFVPYTESSLKRKFNFKLFFLEAEPTEK